MRIIGGNSRGTKLYTLEGLNTRPTLDRVKESMFNILQNNIKDRIILDLFAGSGAIGLEFISRGAKKTFLCEKEKKAIDIINKNIQKMHVESKVKIAFMDYRKFLETSNDKYDLIFLDPPYETDFISKSTELIIKKNLLNDDGIIIAETDQEERVIKELENIEIEIYDIRKYGRAKLIFMRKG